MPIQRRPFRRAIFDFLVSCLCLGIPYLFLERGRHSSRIDEESGMLRSASPMVIIGACTCLVVSPLFALQTRITDLRVLFRDRKAAIVLSASVTFLSLPGLDSVARTAGMVAVLFAAFSMAATGVAVLRHKADLERPISHVGVEGLMVISVRLLSCVCSVGALNNLSLATNGCPLASCCFPGLLHHRFHCGYNSVLLARNLACESQFAQKFLRGLY